MTEPDHPASEPEPVGAPPPAASESSVPPAEDDTAPSPAVAREPVRVPTPAPAPDPGTTSIQVEAGEDLSIGGDLAGRDIINTSTTGVGTQNIGTVRVGWSEQAVVRLALVVGTLVFVTAACFFSGGLAVGGLVFNAFRDRPLSPMPEQAETFQQRLDAIEGTQSGQGFTLTLNEEELNAFVHYRLGEQIGFVSETGEARLVDDGGRNLIAVRGDYAPLGGMPVIVTFALTDAPGAPLQLTGASARIFGGRDGGLGWVLVPVDALRAVEVQINALLGDVQLEQAVIAPDAPDGAPWEVTGEVR